MGERLGVRLLDLFGRGRPQQIAIALDGVRALGRCRPIPGAFGGKGSVSVQYANEAAKPQLLAFDAVLERHGRLA